MIKYVFLIIFIVFICFADPSSLFLDEGTKRLLYSDDSDLDDGGDGDDFVVAESPEDSEPVSESKQGAPVERKKPQKPVSIGSRQRTPSVEKENTASSEMQNANDLGRELEELQKSLDSAKTSGTGVADIEQIQSEFVDDIYSEWGNNGSTGQ